MLLCFSSVILYYRTGAALCAGSRPIWSGDQGEDCFRASHARRVWIHAFHSPKPLYAQCAISCTCSTSRANPWIDSSEIGWIQLNQRIYVPHPVKGETMAHVLGRIVYSELWQQSRGPQSPWVPTGNVFLGFWLEGGMFLLGWQNRAYLLDEAVDLSDADIQTIRAARPQIRPERPDRRRLLCLSTGDVAHRRYRQVPRRPDGRRGAALSNRSRRALHSLQWGQRPGFDGRGLRGRMRRQDTAWVGYQIEEEDVAGIGRRET